MGRTIALGIAAICALSVAAQGQDIRERAGLYGPTVWDLKLGAHASELPAYQYIDFACGTDGGPPSSRLTRFTDYANCPKDASTGLHEVYFEYDDELEYIAKARSNESQLRLYEGTMAYGQPIIVSALFDNRGFLIGIRMLTDQRAEPEVRERGAGLTAYLASRFGDDRWSCENLARRDGEAEYRGVYIKRQCRQTDAGDGYHLLLETHSYRKLGQAAIDPNTRQATVGQFESTTRFEIFLSAGVTDGEARLAALVPLGPTDVERLADRVRSCPGCDLRGSNLKGADLRNANLAGANLAGANLHAANLEGSNLSGADLTKANLNRADMKRATLINAILAAAMLSDARLDGADLSGADLSGSLARGIQMIGAKARGSKLGGADLRDARLNDVDFSRAELTGSWLMNSQLARANLASATLESAVLWGASLIQVSLVGANARNADFYGANLRGADLSRADFAGARLSLANMADTRVDGAVFEGAQLPAGFDPR